MTAHARTFARLCRERLVAQGMTEEEAAEACAEEQVPEPEPEQVKPS
jgi:hypothetical protein